jgi:hypothetical protein
MLVPLYVLVMVRSSLCSRLCLVTTEVNTLRVATRLSTVAYYSTCCYLFIQTNKSGRASSHPVLKEISSSFFGDVSRRTLILKNVP